MASFPITPEIGRIETAKFENGLWVVPIIVFGKFRVGIWSHELFSSHAYFEHMRQSFLICDSVSSHIEGDPIRIWHITKAC